MNWPSSRAEPSGRAWSEPVFSLNRKVRPSDHPLWRVVTCHFKKVEHSKKFSHFGLYFEKKKKEKTFGLTCGKYFLMFRFIIRMLYFAPCLAKMDTYVTCNALPDADSSLSLRQVEARVGKPCPIPPTSFSGPITSEGKKKYKWFHKSSFNTTNGEKTQVVWNSVCPSVSLPSYKKYDLLLTTLILNLFCENLQRTQGTAKLKTKNF